mmetsp:Transcript_74897/g.175694  ORF Transcript_74897/g.175694 Transcript_74897/m.175694 type:complete len:170 (-) Transcript_74897:201-710(-)
MVQIYPQEWSMMDFDYLRAAAYQYYVRNAMTLADLLRATIHADFIDYLLDESEKTLMKDMISIESDIDEAELKQMLPVNPDVLRQNLDNEVSKTRSLDAILLTLGQLRSRGSTPVGVPVSSSEPAEADGSVSLHAASNSSELPACDGVHCSMIHQEEFVSLLESSPSSS